MPDFISHSAPVGGSVVHPKLLERHAEGDEVKEGRDPAVIGVLSVPARHVVDKLIDARILLLETK